MIDNTTLKTVLFLHAYVRETKEDGRTPIPESQCIAMITAQSKAHNLQ